MALIINTNVSALTAQRALGNSNTAMSKAITRLSTGLRINSTADDAAGIAIATKFASQVSGLQQAIRNSSNVISLVQTAEGGITTVTNILQRLRQLSIQSASGDNTPSDRANLSAEADKLVTELTRVTNTTEFNTMSLLDGSFSERAVQIGASSGQTLTLRIGDLRGKSIGGRAEFIANIADGVDTAVNENFSAGEIKIKGVDVVATAAADDQVSVLELAGNVAVNSAFTSTGNISFLINGVSITVSAVSGITAVSQLALFRDAINGAAIANVTAKTTGVSGSTMIIQAARGTNLALAMGTNMTLAINSNLSNLLSKLGVGVGFSAMVASGAAATAINNSNGESSAVAKAVAINSISSVTTVTATAKANIITGAGAIGSAAFTVNAGDLFINGIDIGSINVTASDGTGTLVTAINSKTSSTGVTASVDSSGRLVLKASDGGNITVTTANTTLSGATNLNLSGTGTGTSFVYRSTLSLNSGETFDITSAAGGSIADLDETGGSGKTVVKDLVKFNIAGLKVDTQTSAQAAILTLDSALDDVNKLRAELGAAQNRVEFTISNLEIASENMSASESRIRDADFAQEVANFTRSQILLQAGTAMLAQANTLPQIALQLLQRG